MIRSSAVTSCKSLSPLARKTLGFCKKRANLRKQIVVFHTFYDFVRPHMSFREKGYDTDELFLCKWEQKTPAMTATLTDHVWSFRELLTATLYSTQTQYSEKSINVLQRFHYDSRPDYSFQPYSQFHILVANFSSK